jgi:hypothetical protein
MVTGLLALALLVPIIPVLTAGPAAASTATYNDPNANNTSIDAKVRPQQVTASYSSTSNTIALTLTVAQATDPSSDRGWAAGHQSFVAWLIWTTNPPLGLPVTAAATLRDPTTGQVASGVGTVSIDASGTVVVAENCTDGVHASFDKAHNTYGITFPSSCVSSPPPTSISTVAAIQYDANPGVATPLKGLSPATGPCCTVTPTPDPTAPTTSTTSTIAPVTTVPTASPAPIIHRQPKFTG